jgi:hypothetical protein
MSRVILKLQLLRGQILLGLEAWLKERADITNRIDTYTKGT